MRLEHLRRCTFAYPRWLNDSVAFSTGEVRSRGGEQTVLVVDVAELIWGPIVDEA